MRDMRIRTKSDVVLLYSGILMLMDNVTVWHSLATKDYMTPVVVSYSCLVAVRTRESDEELHINKDALVRSILEAHPVLYALATNVIPGTELPRIIPALAKVEPRTTPTTSPAPQKS